MKDPRMSQAQRDAMSEQQLTDDKGQKVDREVTQFHPWEEETIVVNGQPMTITFPVDES